MTISKDPYIIAEIGSNWVKSNCNIQNLVIAKEQITQAKLHHADAVKFQLFTAQDIYGPKVKGSDFEKRFDKFALPKDFVHVLADHAKKLDIDFMCSAFSRNGFKFVDPYVKVHKLASCEVFDENIIDWLFYFNKKPVYYSDGCGLPTEMFTKRKKDLRMACVTDYPASLSDYDILSYKLPFGLSDHTQGNDLALISYSMGCRVFEKHVDFLSELSFDSPDSKTSMNQSDFLHYALNLKNYVLNRIDKPTLRSRYGRVRNEGNRYYRPIPGGEKI